MQHATEQNPGVIEIVVCRYEARLGAPINPAPPLYANDTSSSPWAMSECKWTGGCVVVTWVRRTLSPLQPQAMIDPIPPLPPPPPGAAPAPYVDDVGPAPAVAAELASAPAPSPRLQHSAVSAAAPMLPIGQTPNLALPPIAALPYYHHLPAYARPREPLPQQRNVTERGGALPPASPIVAPGYQPPPVTVQSSPAPGVVVAGAGLLASAEVRPFGGPLPPSPLDVLSPTPPQESSRFTGMGAVPVVPPTVTPLRPIAPAPRNAPQEANAAVSSRGATDPSGYTESVQVSPPRMIVPPTQPSNSPIDRAMYPRAPIPAPPIPHVAEPEVLEQPSAD